MKNIIKKSFSVFLAVMFVFGAMPLGGIDFGAIAELFRIDANAEAYVYLTSNTELEGDYYYIDISGDYNFIGDGRIESGVTIVKYMGNDKDVVIPSELGGKPVIAIDEYAFCADSLTDSQKEYNDKKGYDYYLANTDCALIESVTIPETVIAIGECAFMACTSLEKVEFEGEGIQWICGWAFAGTALTEINIPRSLEMIDESCFHSTNITEIVFGKNDAEFFSACKTFVGSNIKIVTFKSDGVQVIKNDFIDCYVNTVTFEGSVDIFEMGAMPINNNPVQEIIFKSTYPAEVARMLVLDYGYNCYYYDDYVSFSKRAPAYNGIVKTDEYSYVVEDNYATIIDYFGKSGVVEIPETIGGYIVKKIGASAFRDFSYYDKITGKTIYLSSVTLPSTVEEIGGFAFADNSYLSTFVFNNGLKKIEAFAFEGCTVLYDIALPSSLKDFGDYTFRNTNIKTFSAPGITRIPVSAFENCIKLTSVVLSDELESIGAYAFNGCTALKSIVIPEGITVIEPYTFENCTKLASVTLPESIREIGDYAFNNCTSLKNVTNTGFIETLGEYAFAGAPLTSFDFSSVKGEIPTHCFYLGNFEGTTVTIPASVEKIGEYAFYSCDFSELVLNDGLKEIGKYAFFENENLTKLSIPGSIEVIPQYCFGGIALTELVLNEGIKKIERAAFSTATFDELTIPESLEEIEEKAFYNVKINTLNYNAINCVLTYRGSAATTDYSPFYEYVYAVNIGNKVESLPRLFLADTVIESVTIPESVKKIDSSAFLNCTSLSKVNLPDTVKSISSLAFAYTAITEITIPRDLTTLGSNSLLACSKLETINYNAVNCKISTITGSSGDLVGLSPFSSSTLKALKNFNIGEGVVNIPDSLCAGMTSLEQITLPSTVTDIGDGAFYKCSFESIVLPSKLESIGEFAFACSSLKSIEMPESMRIINRGAFYRCSKLESVDMKNGVVYLGDDVFADCLNLKTVILSENINTIPTRTFYCCDALEEIYIPDSVVRISEQAFIFCSALTKVRMSPNVTYIADEAFYCCEVLNEFIWESDSKLIGRLAFGYCESLKDFNFIGIEKLYENSFENSGISVVTLGEAKNEEAAKLAEIEAQSFMGCDNLESLGIGGNVETIKTQAFANCTNLETAVIADSVTSIAPDAFDGCENLTIYCSSTSYAYTYAQEQGIPVSTFVVEAIPNQTYTGSKIEPEVKVSLSGNSLEANTDFGVTYANNINVGVADVNVKGKGVYKMFASKANFTIVTKKITEVTVAPVADQPYTGEAVTPKLTVTDGVKYLVEGKDYTVTYYKNVEEGTATVKVTGIGNYSGYTTTSFVISEEVKEPNFFEKLIAAIEDFFARIFSFFARMFV